MGHWLVNRHPTRDLLTWENLVLVILLVVAVFSLFHNLDINPRPWHDEGAYLSLAKTLAQDGIYAIRYSDGYQTFGAVQSVGPTVILPIALVFKVFGVGLVQGRVVASVYALFTLGIFYLCARELFGSRTALIAAIVLIISPALRFLLMGRQVLGVIPALGFFLAGWLAWASGVRTGQRRFVLLAGLLIGCAMVTKTQYAALGFTALLIVGLLDLFVYRQGHYKTLIVIGVLAGCCVAAWQGWQILYFGVDTYLDHASKLNHLARGSGLSVTNTVSSIRELMGSESGNFDNFWGPVALLYAGFLVIRRAGNTVDLQLLLIFCCLWLAYFFAFPRMCPVGVMAIVALFIGKLYADLLEGFVSSGRSLWDDIRRSVTAKTDLSPRSLTAWGTLVALITMGLWLGYQLNLTVRNDVMDRIGIPSHPVVRWEHLQATQQVADFLNETVRAGQVVETWERELDVLTDLQYHYPDNSLLGWVQAAGSYEVPHEQELGADYFSSVEPTYVVISWFARWSAIYDMDYLASHADLVKTIGEGLFRYDIYQMK